MGETAVASGKRAPVSARRAAFAAGRLEHLSPAGEITGATLLRAAAEVFTEKGFTDASIDDVARRLGATKGLVYHHYRSKADLYLYVTLWGAHHLGGLVLPVASSRERAATRLKRMADAHLAALLAEPAARHFRRGLLLPPPVQAHAPNEDPVLSDLAEAGPRYDAAFRSMLAAARREGDADARADLEIATRAMLTVLDLPAAGSFDGGAAGAVRDLALAAMRCAGLDPLVIEEEFA